MTAKKVFELNGDFRNSPLIATVRHLDDVFSKHSAEYAVIGGLAVVRNGAPRTTIDVDILTSREAWQIIMNDADTALRTSPDSAIDIKTGVQIDVLFDGNDWEMVIPLAKPEAVREYDRELGAWFIDLPHLLELKTAVYLKKLDEDGIEIAAKDLSDVVALIETNHMRIDEQFVDSLAREVRGEFGRIVEKVQNRSA